MLSGIVRWCLNRPWFIAGLTAAFVLAGLWYARTLPVEILPAIQPAQLVVQTEAPGLVADQVEQIVTRPVETALLGAQGVSQVRSQSAEGLSLLTLSLTPGADPARVRQTVAERIAQAAPALPAGVAPPSIAPMTSADGDVLDIGFTSTRLDAMDLRDLIQWTVRPRLLAAAGVANVAVYGGRTRRIEVRARPGDLSDSDLGFLDVIDAVRRATSVTGAGFMDTPEQRVVIDPRGQALTADDVGAGQIQVVGNAPTRITDVADVADAPAPPTGDALVDGKPGVLVSVSAQYGASVLATTDAVQAALDQLRPVLAARGVQVSVNPDGPAQSLRSALRALAAGLALVALAAAVILFVTLRDLRAVLAVFLALLTATTASLAALRLFGLSLNIMTVGGLFIAAAIVIDDAVIDVEAMLARLRATRDARANHSQAIYAALLEVRAPVVYATLLIDIALTPILLLGGVQGAFLRPLAATVIVASLASCAGALCVTPALGLLLLRDTPPRPETDAARRLKDAYNDWIHRRCGTGRPGLIALGVAALIAAVILPLAPRTDTPALHDGRLVMPIQAPAATSLEAMDRMGAALSQAALADPDVAAASARIGRDPTDFSAWSTDQGELQVDLKPGAGADEQDRLRARLAKALAAYPGAEGPMRSGLGARAPAPEDQAAFSVSVYGQDLDQAEASAASLADALRRLPGAGAVTAQASPRAPSVRIDLNFKRLAIYGLSASDVLDTVQAAFSGKTVAQVYREGRAEDLTVTGPEALKRDPEGAGALLLRSSSGVSTPLKGVANVYLSQTRTRIDHQGGLRRALVLAEPASPGQAAAFSRAALKRVGATRPPPGAFLAPTDAYAAASRERRSLAAESLIATAAMIALLMLIFRDWRMAALILASSLFAFAGGAIALLITGDVLSIGAIAGFVALFGLSTRSAILLVSRPGDVAAARKAEWTLGIVRETAVERAGPILLTSALVVVAMLPLAFSSRLGSEVLGPMADVIMGGALSGAILTLLFLPALIHAYLCPYHRPGAPGGHDHDHEGHEHGERPA